MTLPAGYLQRSNYHPLKYVSSPHPLCASPCMPVCMYNIVCWLWPDFLQLCTSIPRFLSYSFYLLTKMGCANMKDHLMSTAEVLHEQVCPFPASFLLSLWTKVQFKKNFLCGSVLCTVTGSYDSILTIG